MYMNIYNSTSVHLFNNWETMGESIQLKCVSSLYITIKIPTTVLSEGLFVSSVRLHTLLYLYDQFFNCISIQLIEVTANVKCIYIC